MARAIKKKDAEAGGRQIVGGLLVWYDTHARALPWRQPPQAFPGKVGTGFPSGNASRSLRQDPYRVWLSEIMLQQTTVKAVIPYYQKFVARWPGVKDLAAANLDDVLAAWAGLGYYSRARNLHACAKVVTENYGGRFPEDEAELLKLPGIGPYTAAAIAAIAFDRPAAAVDGNIERVVARLFAVEDPLPGSKPKIKQLAALLVPARRPGDFTQAMMDLGAGICSPRSPSCGICPLLVDCEGRRRGIAETLPVKPPKKERPTRYGTAFVAIRSDGAVLLRQRPPKGLLGGMLEVPSTDWSDRQITEDDQIGAAPFKSGWQRLTGTVGHTFTHFHLELEVLRALNVPRGQKPDGCEWYPHAALKDAALPSVMRKVLAHATSGDPSMASLEQKPLL